MSFIDTALDGWRDGGDFDSADFEIIEVSEDIENPKNTNDLDTSEDEFVGSDNLSDGEDEKVTSVTIADPRVSGKAACKDSSQVFFPPEEKEYADIRRAREDRALEVCRSCPIIDSCLSFSLATNDSDGPGEVVGGTRFSEREIMRILGNPPQYLIPQPEAADLRDPGVDKEAEAVNRKSIISVAVINMLAVGYQLGDIKLKHITAITGLHPQSIEKLYPDLKGDAKLKHIHSEAEKFMKKLKKMPSD